VKLIKHLTAIAANILPDRASHTQTSITNELSADNTFNGKVKVACVAGSFNQTQRLRSLVATCVCQQTLAHRF
jgi:hypothetical protein